MAISLEKNVPFNLTKNAPHVTTFRAGLGWDPASDAYDLDVSVFGLTSASGAPKLLGEPWFVYFNNKNAPNDAIVHSGDNLTGEGEGDDENIQVVPTKLAPEIDEVSIIVNIYDAAARHQNFGGVRNAYINIYNDATNEILARYELSSDFVNETAVQVGSFVKQADGDWTFVAIGAGYEKGLNDFLVIYQ